MKLQGGTMSTALAWGHSVQPQGGGGDCVALPRACGGEEEGTVVPRSLAESEITSEIRCCHTNPPVSALSREPQGSPGLARDTQDAAPGLGWLKPVAIPVPTELSFPLPTDRTSHPASAPASDAECPLPQR